MHVTIKWLFINILVFLKQFERKTVSSFFRKYIIAIKLMKYHNTTQHKVVLKYVLTAISLQ